MENYQHYDPIKINASNYELSVSIRRQDKIDNYRNLKQSLERQCENAQWKDERLNTMYDTADEALRELLKEV